MKKMTEIFNQIAGHQFVRGSGRNRSLTTRLWPSAATFTCLPQYGVTVGYRACQIMANTGNPRDVALPARAWVISRAESQEEFTRFGRKLRERLLEFSGEGCGWSIMLCSLAMEELALLKLTRSMVLSCPGWWRLSCDRWPSARRGRQCAAQQSV